MKLRSFFATFIKGLTMGCADAVPGVSGGTIALILGFYDKLIGSLYSCVQFFKKPFSAEHRKDFFSSLSFIIPLFFGVVIALWSATKILVGSGDDGLLMKQNTAIMVYAFFFGLVFASIKEPWDKKKITKKTDWGLAVLGFAVAAFFSLVQFSGTDNLFLFFIAGAIAISVMLLPGVSGSLALLVIGMYQPVVGLLHKLSNHVKGVEVAESLGFVSLRLGLFISGMIIGAVLFIPFLQLILKKQHDKTMSVLSGLMAGSLVALWPWKTFYKKAEDSIPSPILPNGNWWWAIIFAALGIALIALLKHKGKKVEKKLIK